MSEPILTPELEKEIRDIAASYPDCSWAIVLCELDTLRAVLADAERARDAEHNARLTLLKHAEGWTKRLEAAEQARAELVEGLEDARDALASCGIHVPADRAAALIAKHVPETPK